MSQAAEPARPNLGLEKLGSGGREDRLTFRVIVQILMRCLPLLRDLWRHLIALLSSFATVSLIGLFVAITFITIWWNSVLGEQPLSPGQAAFLGLGPGETAQVDALTPLTRRVVAESLSLLGLVLAPVFMTLFLAIVYYQIWILQRINQKLRLHLVDRLQALSLRFHSDTRVGDAIYRMYQDSAMVTQIIDVLFLSPIRAFFGFVVGLVGVAVFNPALALALALIIPPLLLLGLWISWRLRVRFRGAREMNSALTSRIQESLSGIKVIKAYGLEDFERGRFEADSLRAFDAAFSARNMLAFFGVAVFWITSAMVLGAVFWATLQTRDTGSLWLWGLLEGTRLEGFLLTLALTAWTLGSYNNFKFLLGQGSGAAERIMRVWGRTQDIAIGLDRVFEVLDLEPEVQDDAGAVAMPPFRDSIVFDDVSFRYQTDRPVLEHVSLEARSGSIVAIVGPTGSGKSTLMALLLRLFDPSSGSIAIDGRDLRSLQVESVRSNIAIALQENVLFGTSVRENIRYAVPQASDAEVREAARVACADGFIEGLAGGYDTPLGERGTKLSTGQRQRLSIARAILKGSPILVLDEPTASLDAETELQLLRNLAEWGRGRVILLITHRLSTIRRADQIVYLAAGRVGETGSHDELMQRSGSAYRHLVEVEEGQRAGASGGPA